LAHQLHVSDSAGIQIIPFRQKERGFVWLQKAGLREQEPKFIEVSGVPVKEFGKRLLWLKLEDQAQWSIGEIIANPLSQRLPFKNENIKLRVYDTVYLNKIINPEFIKRNESWFLQKSPESDGQRYDQIDSTQYSLFDFYYLPDPDLFYKTFVFKKFSDDVFAKKNHAWFRPLYSGCYATVLAKAHEEVAANQKLMFASNNYLGLATDPDLIRAAQDATAKYGVGTGGSNVLSGTMDIHVKLQFEVSAWLQKEDALLFVSGYAANVGTLSALLRKDDLVLCDELSHASIHDGIRLSEARKINFKHNDLNHLEHLMKKNASSAAGKLLIFESIYSMDGDEAPIKEYIALAKKYGYRTYVDEAHGIGVRGQDGRGLCDELGMLDQIDVYMGTFTKAIGSSGAFVSGSKTLINYLRYYARSQFFSTSLAPAQVAASRMGIHKLQTEPQLKEKLFENIKYFKKCLKENGFEMTDDVSPIIPIIVGDSQRLREISRDLENQGIYVSPVAYPAVPEKSCRLRFSLMASHTQDELNRTARILKKAFQ
jgi:glycine C-acetyltransferase